MLKQGRHVLPQAKRVLAMLSGRNGQSRLVSILSERGQALRQIRPVPFLLMSNSGGMPEAERCKALSAEFEVEVR